MSEDRLIIEAALLQSTPLRTVGQQYGFHRNMLQRHMSRHLAGQVAYLAEQRKREHAKVVLDAGREAMAKLEGTRPLVAVSALETPEDVLTEARGLFGRTMSIFMRAETLGDSNVALRAAKEAREQLQLFGRAFKMFDEGGTTIDRSTKVVSFVSGLTESEMRRYLNGGILADG